MYCTGLPLTSFTHRFINNNGMPTPTFNRGAVKVSAAAAESDCSPTPMTSPVRSGRSINGVVAMSFAP